MLIVSDIVREYLIANLVGTGFWPAGSVLSPANVTQYIYISSISETEINEKKTKLTEGSVLISITERFPNDAGTLANVDAQTRLVSNKLQPTAQSIFGNYKNVRIFSTNIQSSSGELFDVPNGRVAIRNLTLMYRAEQIF
jgi:hypothetical protein